MSITIRPTTNPDLFINRLGGRLDNIVSRSNIRALNKGIDAAATVAVKLIAQKTSLKQKTIRSKLKKFKAARGNEVARLDARKANPPNLINAVSPGNRKVGYFDEMTRKAYKTRTGIRRPAKYKAKGVKARTYGSLRVHKSTFIAKSKNQNLIVFSRKGNSNYPLKPIFAPSIKREFSEGEIQHAFSSRAEEVYSKELNRLVEYEIKKAGFG